jgi:hypothetical protein
MEEIVWTQTWTLRMGLSCWCSDENSSSISRSLESSTKIASSAITNGCMVQQLFSGVVDDDEKDEVVDVGEEPRMVPDGSGTRTSSMLLPLIKAMAWMRAKSDCWWWYGWCGAKGCV